MSEEDAGKKVPPKLTIANLKKIECEVCKQGNKLQKKCKKIREITIHKNTIGQKIKKSHAKKLVKSNLINFTEFFSGYFPFSDSILNFIFLWNIFKKKFVKLICLISSTS